MVLPARAGAANQPVESRGTVRTFYGTGFQPVWSHVSVHGSGSGPFFGRLTRPRGYAPAENMGLTPWSIREKLPPGCERLRVTVHSPGSGSFFGGKTGHRRATLPPKNVPDPLGCSRSGVHPVNGYGYGVTVKVFCNSHPSPRNSVQPRFLHGPAASRRPARRRLAHLPAVPTSVPDSGGRPVRPATTRGRQVSPDRAGRGSRPDRPVACRRAAPRCSGSHPLAGRGCGRRGPAAGRLGAPHAIAPVGDGRPLARAASRTRVGSRLGPGPPRNGGTGLGRAVEKGRRAHRISRRAR